MEPADEETRAESLEDSAGNDGPTLDFTFPRAKLSAKLQLSIDSVGYALRAVDGYVPDRQYSLPRGVFAAISHGMPGSMPGLPVAMQIGPSLIPAGAHGLVTTSWLLRKGMGDIITTMSVFALEIFIADAVAKVMASPTGTFEEMEQVNSIDGPRAIAFDKKPLHEKLGRLRSIVQVDDVAALLDLEERILTINRARNCLEHRDGRIGPPDCNVSQPKALALRWVAFAATHEESGENVRPGDDVGAMRIQQRAPRERTFAVGSHILLSAQDFTELCWTVNQYGEMISVGLMKRLETDPGLAGYARNNNA